MRKHVRILLALLISLTLTIPALAQEPIDPEHSDPTWQAQYWSNPSLSGRPLLEWLEADLDHDWGTGSPHPSVPADEFSARWSRYVSLPAGVYRFSATSDDGIRVWVDGDLIIDEWYDHAATTYAAEKTLSTGHHQVIVEYYEHGGEAVAQLSWERVLSGVDGWYGEYFDNPSLSGDPVLVRDDPSIDFEWGIDSPAPVVPEDYFSARWTGYVELDAGLYRFTAASDDGVRVWVDNDLIIDEWSEHPVRSFRAEKRLEAGRHWIKVEYYEAKELAQVELSWELLTSMQDWRGEYYDNPDLTGPPALVRLDPRIEFNWLWSSPAPNVIPPDRFSVRWSQTVDLEPGYYQFAMTVDDGGRLWVDDHLLIDGWQDQVARTYTGDIYLTGGDTFIQMEYYENEGVASARLSWTRLGQLPAPGTVVVDDTYANFRTGGPSEDWHVENEGYADQLTWSLNSDGDQSGYNWAGWYPDLLPGRYQVLAYIPVQYTTTSNARYLVRHADGQELRSIDQSRNGGRWVPLGTYYFEGDEEEYVMLTDVTFEAAGSRLVAFDAIKWVPR